MRSTKNTRWVAAAMLTAAFGVTGCASEPEDDAGSSQDAIAQTYVLDVALSSQPCTSEALGAWSKLFAWVDGRSSSRSSAQPHCVSVSGEPRLGLRFYIGKDDWAASSLSFRRVDPWCRTSLANGPFTVLDGGGSRDVAFVPRCERADLFAIDVLNRGPISTPSAPASTHYVVEAVLPNAECSASRAAEWGQMSALVDRGTSAQTRMEARCIPAAEVASRAAVAVSGADVLGLRFYIHKDDWNSARLSFWSGRSVPSCADALAFGPVVVIKNGAPREVEIASRCETFPNPRVYLDILEKL